MTSSVNLTPLRTEDYEAIETAVLETARGRWFMREYAHRNRTADTNMLLEAIGRIENALALNAIDTLSASIGSVSDSDIDAKPLIEVIDNARAEISAIRDELLEEGVPAAADPLAATAASADAISASIFEQARGLQETVYKLRDAGAHQLLCDALDECAGQLMRICQKQDLNARRTAEAMRALQDLDERLSGVPDLTVSSTEHSVDNSAIESSPITEPNPETPDSDEDDEDDLSLLPLSVPEENLNDHPSIAPSEDETGGDGHIVFVDAEGAQPPLVNFSLPKSCSEQELEQNDPLSRANSEESTEKPLVFVP